MDFPKELIYLTAFGSVALFVAVVAEVLNSSWKRYDEEVLKGAAVSFDQIYLNIPPQQLLTIAVVLFLVVTGFVMLIFGSLGLALIVGLVAFLSPRLLAIILKRRRDTKFGTQLVDALMNVSNALRTGFSLPQAFELIQREMDNPIHQEFRLLNQETRVGVPMETALENLLARMPSDDLDLVVTAVLVSQEVGGSLAEVMDNISR
ncbi:type II secretion system F family protein, partial [bacterium]|nr:type II secretion system F family protein [bacterium]